jgi:hypothetical protein
MREIEPTTIRNEGELTESCTLILLALRTAYLQNGQVNSSLLFRPGKPHQIKFRSNQE